LPTGTLYRYDDGYVAISGGGGGGGTDFNAVHYTVDTGKTVSQKRKARQNIDAVALSEIPMAAADQAGLVVADSVTTSDTQPVRINSDGKLFTEANGARLDAPFTVSNGIGLATNGRTYVAGTSLVDIVKDMLTTAGNIVYFGVVDTIPPTSISGFVS